MPTRSRPARPPPNFLVGGYNNGMLRNSPYGAGATPEAITAADAAIAALIAGEPIYKGTLKDNNGNVVVDKTYDNYDPYLDGMNWLLEGVVGLDHLTVEGDAVASAHLPRPAGGEGSDSGSR